MGKSQLDKGKRFEREVAILLRRHWPKARRGLQYRDGSDHPDVMETPFWVECKVGARPNPLAALAQAEMARNKSCELKPPVAICKSDGKRITVTMSLNDWLDLFD